MAEQIEIVKNAAQARYELLLDGQRVGLADYRERGDVVVIPHTETLPAWRGRGLAARLVQFALDDIGEQGKLVDPVCPFVATFIGEHPEYAKLLD